MCMLRPGGESSLFRYGGTNRRCSFLRSFESEGSTDSAQMKHVLFICSQNRLRSPTAERVFSDRPGFEVASAGLDSEAETPVSPELLEWSDIIFVMEKAHRNKLSSKFKRYLNNKRVICLDIPDEFEYMDAGLVRLLEAKVGRFFR